MQSHKCLYANTYNIKEHLCNLCVHCLQGRLATFVFIFFNGRSWFLPCGVTQKLICKICNNKPYYAAIFNANDVDY